MKCFLAVVVLGVVLLGVNSKQSPPKVEVYSRNPGKYGVPNTLICHVSGFHPPDISITLLQDGVEIPNPKQSDLAFEQTWQFHLTKTVPFTPVDGKSYTCKVRHMQSEKTYTWEPDM